MSAAAQSDEPDYEDASILMVCALVRRWNMDSATTDERKLDAF